MNMNKDRGFFLIPEAARYLGRRESTIKKWIQTGRAIASLYVVNGHRVRRVLKSNEVDRLLQIEIPDEGQYPDSFAQRWWDRRKGDGAKGSATRMRTLARRKAEGEQREVAKHAVKDMAGREHEDIDEWAQRLAKDITHQDQGTNPDEPKS